MSEVGWRAIELRPPPFSLHAWRGAILVPDVPGTPFPRKRECLLFLRLPHRDGSFAEWGRG